MSWVTGPGTGCTAPLPNDWLPNKAEGGKFITAGAVNAGSCHWHLIVERWADQCLGEGRATPRKDTVIFRANWTRILRNGVYVVEDEGKYHGFVVGQTLSRPGALRVKCEDEAPQDQQSAVRAVLAERERGPTSQLRQALAAIKENVDTRVRVCPPASMSTWPIGPKNAHGWPAGALYRRRSKQLFLATFQSVTKKRLKNLLNVAGTGYWNVARTLILAILHVGGGHPDQPVGPARRSGDPSLARKRSTAHLFGYVASAVALAACRRALVPQGRDGLRGSPRQHSRDAHRGVGQHWRPIPSAAALPTSGRRGPPPRPHVHRPCNPNPRTSAQPPKQHPNPKPNPNAPPSGNLRAPPNHPPKKGRGSRGSPPARSRPATPQRTPPRGPPPTPRRSRSPNPAPRPRSPPNPLARLPREPRPPNPSQRPSQRQDGGGMQIQSGGASVCRFSGQWGVGDRAGQRGPCRAWPPRDRGDMDLLPQRPRTLRHPESVGSENQDAGEVVPRQDDGGRGGGQGGRRGRGRGERRGREQRPGRGRGRRRGWNGGRFGCYRG